MVLKTAGEDWEPYALTVLATPLTHWMTGNVIGVDGGEVMGSRETADIP